MADKQPTQAVPGEAAGKPKAKETIPQDRRGAGGGGPIGPKDTDGDFHGGQTEQAYHGYGRLGEEKVKGQSNPNSPSDEN